MIPQTHYRCWVEVDLDALRQNITSLRARVGPRVKILAVVKADAYGHGLPQIARVLMQTGIYGFGVANLTEAIVVRQLGGPGWPILMFGSALAFELDKLVEHEIITTISSADEARQLNAAAARHHRVHPIHVEVDTGMGRVGCWHEQAPVLLREIATLPNLRLTGLYTHFPSADENPQRSRQALALFQNTCPPDPQRLRHAANTAALLNLPETHLDMVRPGLALYGIAPGLMPILTFKARVAFVKDVAPGRTISYGETFIAPRPMTVATVAVGYADGFARHLSNKAHVLIAGRRCPVIGRVTMDQIMVDVTGLPPVHSGDEVVIIGRQGAQEITARDVADWEGTIPWEVLCGITKTARVPRVYTGLTAA
jgi:alanine racemase